MELRVSSYSAKGVLRDRNQDSYLVEHIGNGYFLAAVADGMGGLVSGEVASELAVGSVAQGLREMLRSGGADPGEELRRLERCVAWANELVYSKGVREFGGPCMGTTLTAALISGRRVSLAHVGDSRAYLISGATLKQLTYDHSLVGEMVRNGDLTERQAMNHPKKNLLTNALGTHRAVQVDLLQFTANHDDMILLCTDGLTTAVESPEIHRIALEHQYEPRFTELAATLVNEALKNGSTDDITVVAVWLVGEGDAK
ncbi:MAG: PP2C family protein-serine/threonine phosphatase [Bacillota bacterium]